MWIEDCQGKIIILTLVRHCSCNGKSTPNLKVIRGDMLERGRGILLMNVVLVDETLRGMGFFWLIIICFG